MFLFQLLEEMKLMNDGLNILNNIKQKQQIATHAAKIRWKGVTANSIAVMGTMLTT